MPDMSPPADKGFGQSSSELARWAERVYQPEDEVLAEIRARSVAAGLPAIAVGRFDGLHLEVLARAAGARRAVEIGTLGGYSGVCLLRGLGPDGFLHTFEYREAHAEVARESFRKAGFAGRVAIHVGRALEELAKLDGEAPFDLVFIDADKVGYPAYLGWAEEHLRVGGVVLCDNAFGWGGVAAPEAGGDRQSDLQALADTSARLGAGGRWRATMLPTNEGLAFGVKIR
jgi:predicted O-methyltransferase YrrM